METTLTEALEAGQGPLSLIRNFLPDTLSVTFGHGLFVWGLAAAALVFIFITPILFYHWKRYAVRPGEYVLARTVYLVVAGLLAAGMIATGINLSS